MRFLKRFFNQFRAKFLTSRSTMKRKLSVDEVPSSTNATLNKKCKKKEFDFLSYNQRHVALKIAYLGANYSGFVIQPNADNTIEAKLMKSLVKCKLIMDRDSCNYSRCGRTDKGVSAMGQVVALDLRSNLDEGIGVITLNEDIIEDAKDKEELSYVQMIQANLPPDIRIVAWAPVPLDFSARFSCLYRTYKYFFPRGIFDIEKMQEAAAKFEGEHDFRNICKMDPSKVQNFIRTVQKIRIRIMNPDLPLSHQVCELTVTARSFLYNQVRYMMGVLTLVGVGKESPDVIDYLFDVDACDAKPNFSPAQPDYLILYDAGFEDIEWQLDPRQFLHIYTHFQKQWLTKSLEQQMLNGILESFDPRNFEEDDIKQYNLTFDPVTNIPLSTMGKVVNLDVSYTRRRHTPIREMKRTVGGSFEERINRIQKRYELKHASRQSNSEEN